MNVDLLFQPKKPHRVREGRMVFFFFFSSWWWSLIINIYFRQPAVLMTGSLPQENHLIFMVSLLLLAPCAHIAEPCKALPLFCHFSECSWDVSFPPAILYSQFLQDKLEVIYIIDAGTQNHLEWKYSAWASDNNSPIISPKCLLVFPSTFGRSGQGSAHPALLINR